MDKSNVLKLLRPGRIIYPIAIGLLVAGFLFFKDFNKDSFSSINWTWYSGVWCLVALMMMAIRDLAYIYRIRVLTDKELTWKKGFQVIMLWEFASAVTPSIVGGSAVAIFIIHREIINVGKSTAIVMVTSLLDELFYIIMVPLVYFTVGREHIFSISGMSSIEEMTFGYGLFYVFIFGYLFLFTYCLIIIYALFYKPRVIKWLFIKMFSLPLLKRWRKDAAKAGDDLIIASKEIKGKPRAYWIKAGTATFFSWTARFWVVNFLILIPLVSGIGMYENLLIYARQLVMWVILLISPTPGGSGVAEIIFSVFLGDFIPKGLSSTMALLWRLMSYYPYLIIGAVILPGWLKRVYAK